jgi:hypothetical protein
VVKNGFKIQYQDKTGSSGDMISDDLIISTGTVHNLEMGLAFQTTVGYGLMGIGYDVNEAASTGAKYPNLIDQLVTQGLINAKVYSLYLNDRGSSTGSVLFGGIDKAKFSGQLKVIPTQKDARTGYIREFLVTMTSLSITDQSGKSTSLSTSSANIVLDSGTSLTYLPSAMVTSIIKALNAYDDTRGTGLLYADCALLSTQSKSYMTFSFGGAGGPQISVPIQELITRTTRKPSKSPFTDTCLLGILAGSSGGPYAFGDTFLRSAYVVYDLDHNQIGLAQTNYRAASSDIYEIPKGANGIPLLSGAGAGVGAAPTSSLGGSAAVPTFSTEVPPKSQDSSADDSAPTTVVGGGGTVASTSTATRQTTGGPTATQGGVGSVTTSATSTGSKAAANSKFGPFDSSVLVVCAVSLISALLGGLAIFA